MSEKSRQPTFKERALYLLNPEKASRKYNERLKRENEQGAGKSESVKMSYGSHGASTTKNSMLGWQIQSGNAEDDIDLYSANLRKRARDLYESGGLARSGPATLNLSVTGWGIKPKPKIDADFLGLSEEAQEETERTILREYRLWAENTMCDAEHQKNFYEMQQLAFLSMLMSGDVFALFGMKPNKRTPYQTTVRILEADRVCTEDSNGESESKTLDGGGRVIDGVEISKDGEVLKYWIASRNPEAREDASDLVWTAIDAYGKDTGYPNILHLMTFERPEQRRGVPFVSPVIESIKQLGRYTDAELASNVVSAMLTAFITTNEDDGKSALEDAVNEDEKVTDDEMSLELRSGAIYELSPGKHVETVNPLRNNTGFQNFVDTFFVLIGSAMGIPKEVLIKKYDSNYTAARGALLDFWRLVTVYRNRFIDRFCQPIYEQWLAEAVATGRIEAPGFFDDPAVRQAWCGCKWMGCSMGHVDPRKEVEAAEKRIQLNISTQEQEAMEYNGADWSANVRQRKHEVEIMRELYPEMQEETTEKTEDEEEKEDAE